MIEEEMSTEELPESCQMITQGGVKNVIWIHTEEDR